MSPRRRLAAALGLVVTTAVVGWLALGERADPEPPSPTVPHAPSRRPKPPVIAPLADDDAPAPPAVPGIAPRPSGLDTHAMATVIRATMEACKDIGRRCASRVTVRHPLEIMAPINFLLVSVDGGAGAVVQDVRVLFPSEESAWTRCTRQELLGATIPLPFALQAPFVDHCMPQGAVEPLLPWDFGLGPFVAPCFKADSGVSDVDLSVDLVFEYAAVALEHATVTGPAALDAWTRRCIELAVQRRFEVPPDEGYRVPVRREDHAVSVSLRDDSALEEPDETPLPARGAARPWPPPAPTEQQRIEAEALVDAAMALPRADYAARIEKLETCAERAPGYPDCYALLGSAYASVASRDLSVEAMERAREAYQRYLELAPPDGLWVKKVRAILEAVDQR